MDFTSNISVILLVAFFLIYFTLDRFLKYRTRTLTIFIAGCSLGIYAFWYPPAVLILLAYAILVRYYGILLHRYRKRILLGTIIMILIIILMLFKYHFVITLMYMKAGKVTPFTLFLPLGISFYTLSVIGYFIDLYRGVTSPAETLIDAVLFVSFWPSLSSGPILRSDNFFAHIKNRESLTVGTMTTAFVLITTGIIKKLLIADNLGAWVNWNLSFGAARLGIHEAWITMLGFVGQIYGDFSGYSDMAIGLALLVGFKLPANFNYPYAADSVTELWRRWHISLSSWLRDYVYIPLGGNRKGKLRQHINIMITFFVSGLWHSVGSLLNYIVWALSNGFIIVLEQQFKGFYERVHPRIRHGITLLLFTITATFFRLDINQALHMLKKMFGVDSLYFSLSKPIYILPIILILIFLVIEHWVKFYRVDENGAVSINTKPTAVFLLCALTILSLFFSGASQQFFYFQF